MTETDWPQEIDRFIARSRMAYALLLDVVGTDGAFASRRVRTGAGRTRDGRRIVWRFHGTGVWIRVAGLTEVDFDFASNDGRAATSNLWKVASCLGVDQPGDDVRDALERSAVLVARAFQFTFEKYLLVGNRKRFAIEAIAENFPDNYVLGRFRFWVSGLPVGNWDDLTHLSGCVGWLRDFHTRPRDRTNARLEGLDGAGVFALLWDPVFGPGAIPDPRKQPIPYAHSRFDIGHLGMTSFDLFDLLLVKTLSGTERILWRRARDPTINECLFDDGEMEDVARRFCEEFAAAVDSRAASGGAQLPAREG